MTEQFAGLNNQLHKEMEAEIAQLEKVLLNGNISSMEEYKRIVGRRTGILLVVTRHKELISLLEQR
jgi:hypothetical protein